MLKNYLVSKEASGEVKALVASSSAPAPSGAALVSAPTFGTDTGLNRLYAFVSWQEFTTSPNIITGTLQHLSSNMYCLLYSGSILSYVTPFVDVCISFNPKVITDPFSISTPVGDSVISKRVYWVCVESIGGR